MIQALTDSPCRQDMVYARSMEDNIFISVIGAAPGTTSNRNQIIGQRDGALSSEVFDLAA